MARQPEDVEKKTTKGTRKASSKKAATEKAAPKKGTPAGKKKGTEPKPTAATSKKDGPEKKASATKPATKGSASPKTTAAKAATTPGKSATKPAASTKKAPAKKTTTTEPKGAGKKSAAVKKTTVPKAKRAGGESSAVAKTDVTALDSAAGAGVPPVPTGASHLLADGVPVEDFWSLVHCQSWDPHRLLGAHAGSWNGEDGIVVRGWHPDARQVDLLIHGEEKPVPMESLEVPGVFAVWLSRRAFPLRYTLRFTFPSGGVWEIDDPYQFMPSLGDLDLWLHSEGNHYHAYRKFGAQLTEMDGVRGVAFCLWAPSAKRVSVIGEFNNWDGRLHPMRSMGGSGVWELFVPGVSEADGYKYEILTQDGHLRFKADPYAFGFDLRPSTHSKVVNLNAYAWKDSEYMRQLQQRQPLQEPVAIYEVHLGSWMRVPEEGNRWMTYRELAHSLVPHVQRYGFTHVELLPVAEHPFDGSWGYQVTGYYAPTSRFGSPDDFKYFVDYMHQHGIGVLVDWVPAHFPRDDFALRWFDGSALYEHSDPRRGEHKDWGTLIFDYGRPEVKNFLLSNALFWLDEYHIDGLRVDAVASMLYLDYSRQPGEWVPNQFGGNENLEAIAFLRQLNEVIHGQYPGRFMVAEESTAFTGVSRPTYSGGLGFTFKWNMGWMNDTLRYFQRDPVFRQHHQNDLTFALVYQYTENFILPFSHDEVVHGKGSLLAKMPGDWWQKFANLRLLYSYLYAHPGKKLLFMGAEFGQYNEWDYARSLDWHVAGSPLNKGIERMLESLGWTYRRNREFWLFDNEPIGFRWIDFSDNSSSVLSFVRQGPEGHILCVFNFTPVPRLGYRVGAPGQGTYREIFNSDAGEFGGSNVGNYGQVFTQELPWHGCPHSIHLNIPPLGAVFLKHEE